MSLSGPLIRNLTKISRGLPYRLQKIAEAARTYPTQIGQLDCHHVYPQYMGGPANGPKVRLPGPYHEAITQAFRKLAPYGTGARYAPGWTKLFWMLTVYLQYPIDGFVPC